MNQFRLTERITTEKKKRFTCRVCYVLLGYLAWLAIANIIESQDSELVMHIWGELEVSCGLSARHLCQVMPGATIVKSIFILNEELWKKRRRHTFY